jgi:hopanoid biosynthesis associated protein HpnK
MVRPLKRLIVNADDFGLTSGVNSAIAACHRGGIVSSTTLMATGSCVEEAVELARQMPGLSVGCHVLLLDGEPVLPVHKVRSLMGPVRSRFRPTLGSLLRAMALGQLDPAEIEAEAAAQMGRLQEFGVRLSHFDSHKHVHMFPSILRPLLRAAAAHGVTAVRNPFEAPGVVTFSAARRSRRLLLRKAQTTVLRGLLRGRWLQAVREAGIATTDGSLGVASTGIMNEARLRAMLQRMPSGTWELVCHPGYNDSGLAAVHTKLRASREVEMRALQSITQQELLEQYGAELAAFDATGERPAGAVNF